MKVLSIAIILCSLVAAGGFAVEKSGKKTQDYTAATLEIPVARDLPTSNLVREDDMLKKIDKMQHDLAYLKGRTEALKAKNGSK